MSVDEIFNSFKTRAERALSLTGITTEIMDLVLDPLKKLIDECDSSIQGQNLLKNKITNSYNSILSAKENDSLKQKYKELDEQSIIIIVSAFEDFMSQLFMHLTTNYTKYINWPEKLPLELGQLKYKPKTSLAELIYSSLKGTGQINFQDLQSTIKYLEEKVGVDSKKIFTDQNLKNKIILFQAVRHSLVHNQGRIDPRFLNQIRETGFLESFEKDKVLSINAEMVKDCMESFVTLAEKISSLVKDKINEWEPPIIVDGKTINIDDIPF